MHPSRPALALVLLLAALPLTAGEPPAAPPDAPPAEGAAAAPVGQGVAITVLPETPLVSRGRGGQELQFDLLLENREGERLELAGLVATVLDGQGGMIAQRHLGTNGMSILTLPDRVMAAGERIVVFNPFVTWDAGTDLSTIRYDFELATGPDGDGDRVVQASVTVHPRPYATKTALVLPVAARVFVHDGHDLYAHHRRLDLTGPMTTALGIRTNMTRYAYDFMVTDAAGKLYRGDGSRNEDWYGWGVPILAPGDGVVVEAVDGIPDNRLGAPAPMAREEVMKNLKRIFGNYVLVDHRDGEWSLLAHLRNGSVRVKPGDTVRAGQPVAAMGFSGDAMQVHLHYQLQSDAAFGEGLPSTFHGVRLRVGAERWIDVPSGAVDSGDVVESVPAPATPSAR